jgi:dolichol kinase
MGGNRMINDSAFEIRRKMMHVFIGVIIVVLVYYSILKFWMALTLLIIGIITSLLSKKYSLPLISLFLMRYDRPEHSKTPGRGVISIFSSVSVLLLLLEAGVLQKNIVLASLMIWIFGDSLSAVVGKVYGKNKHPLNNRYVEGTIAGIIGGAIGALFFVPIYAAFPAAVITMVIESLELRFLKHPIDDNILVPLIAAGLLYWIL